MYSPKHDDVNKYLKVECIPVLGEIEYPPIFAISSLVSPGMSLNIYRSRKNFNIFLLSFFVGKLPLCLMLFYVAFSLSPHELSD